MAGIKGGHHHHQNFSSDQYYEDYYQGPNFDFPKLPTTPSTTIHHIKDTIITTAKTLITDVSVNNNNTTEQNVTSLIANNGTNFNDVGAVKISNTVVDLLENKNSSILTDVFQMNDTLDIATKDNSTFVSATDGKGAGWFTTTTENIVDYISNATKNLVSPTTKKYDWPKQEENVTMSHQGSDNYDDSYQTTYVIMGIIIAILLIVIGVITYFYVTHKKKHVVAMHGQYTTGTKRNTQYSAGQNLESPENDSFKC